jgi:hypothetical protein
VLLGAVNSVSNNVDVWSFAYVSKALGNDWSWLLLGYAAAWNACTWRPSLSRSISFLWAAVATYYVFDAFLNNHLTWNGVLRDAMVWLCIATGLAVVLATLRVVVKKGGLLGVVASALVPSYVTWRAWRTNQWLAEDPSLDPELLDVTATLWPVGLVFTLIVVIKSLSRSVSTSGRQANRNERTSQH